MKRLALLSEVLHPPLDEGVRILAAELGAALARNWSVTLMGERDAEVKGLHVEGVLADRFFAGGALARALVRARPDAIIYIPWTSLTARTFLRVAMLRRRAPGTPLGIVAVQPRSSGALTRLALRFGRPDRLFALGPEVLKQAGELGLSCERLAGGVDLDRFRPLGSESAPDLRRSLGFPMSPYVVLHVGHLKRSRGVLALKSVQALSGVQAVLIASSSTDAEAETRRELQEAGVRVVDQHLVNIEAYYRAADCYLFPVTSSLDAIELPLSVLEAMACNLPVILSRFGGLKALLPGVTRGVVFVGSEEEIPRAVISLRADRPVPDFRERLSGLTWDAMARQIAEGLGARG